MSDENRSANISEEPGAISVQARMEQPPLPPVFGHVPDHINLHFDLESGILDDLEARYPYLVIQRAGVDFDILPVPDFEPRSFMFRLVPLALSARRA